MSAPFDLDRYHAAWRFAADAHRGQEYPGAPGIPYILHLSSVAAEVIASVAVEPTDRADLAVTCALLHDSVEDTDVTPAQVAARFGEDVAAGVSALSKSPGLPKAEAMADSLARIRACPGAVWRVKLADRICNLQAPPHYWSQEKCRRYRAEAGTILAALGEASPYLAARLAGKIRDYARYSGEVG